MASLDDQDLIASLNSALSGASGAVAQTAGAPGNPGAGPKPSDDEMPSRSPQLERLSFCESLLNA